MDFKPLVSIVIPVYNTEKYIIKCINSVLNQNYVNKEIILVDDGSPDNCPKICDDFAKYYSNVYVIHKKNGGLSEARNCGIDKSNGEYLLFIDSDDFLIEDAIEKLINTALTNEADIVIPDRYIEFNENTKLWNNYLHFKSSKDYEPVQFVLEVILGLGRAWRATAVLYRGSIIRKNNIKFPVGYISEDIIFNLKFLAHSKKLKIYNKPTLIQNKRRNSISTSFHHNLDEIIINIDNSVHDFLIMTNNINFYGENKRNELLCRNTIVYISLLFSRKCPFDLTLRYELAYNFLKQDRVKEAFRIKRINPYFNNQLVILYFKLMFFIIKKGYFNISFTMAKFASKFKSI